MARADPRGAGVLLGLPAPGQPPAEELAADPDYHRILDAQGDVWPLLVELADNRIAGGSVYDALVAAPAIEHALPLVSRDRRALSTYRDLGADVEFPS